MKRAKVTFFMIAYNEEKLVQRAVQSVLDQTEPDIEIYVRNNGSSDRTGEIVREMMEKDSRVHLVENKVNWAKDEAGNIPFTNEQGTIDIWPIDRETLGDYVSFIDADDSIEPTFTEELLRVARKEQAEITVCGSIFLQDGSTPVGQRLPPPLHLKKRDEWGAALKDFNTFVQLYNSFRTYWGKLFRRDFFLKYYDEVWKPAGGNYGGFLDTAVMLRCLKRCLGLSCVIKPLYLFTIGNGSTYANFPSSLSLERCTQAEALFEEGKLFLDSKEALTQENYQFLYQLNWAFCWEGMEGLQRAPNATPQDLDRIIILLNNRVAAAYLPQNSQNICGQIKPVLQAIWSKNGQKMELYLRYPIRLMYARELAERCPGSELLPVLILGVLCDVENQNLLGYDLLALTARHFHGLESSIGIGLQQDWTLRHSGLRNWWVEQIQAIDSDGGTVDILAQELKEAFEQGQYEQASELLSRVSKKSPLHRNGIYYRIQLAELIGEHELAVVLAASARVLFGLDMEMQRLCCAVLK